MLDKDELTTLIGCNIKRERERAGMTQEVLAEKVNLDVKTLSKIERGKVGISVMTLYQLCNVLSISSSVILSPASHDTNIRGMIEQLTALTPEQFDLVSDTVKNMLKAFRLGSQ